MTVNCKGKLIDLSSPKVMGILNVTPDSFYDGGHYNSLQRAVDKAGKMLSEGADFIDVGGYSSRPNAQDIPVKEEIARVVPVIESLVKQYPDALISVDTFRSEVAKEAVLAGASMVNDISSGLLDRDMMQTVSALGVPYIMMHMKGSPQTMKTLENYSNITKEVVYYFSERIAVAKKKGINDMIIDPGFGFAKNINQNFELLSSLELLQFLELPILIGLSRKSMIYKKLEITANEALNGTTALHMIALQRGGNILRVHDVKEAKQCVKLKQELSN